MSAQNERTYLTHPFADVYVTPRELQMLYGLVDGLTNAEIAQQYAISARTVDDYYRRLRSKLNCYTKIDLLKALMSAYGYLQ